MAISSMWRRVPAFNAAASGNPIRTAWDQLHALPGGKRIFSIAVGRFVAYTGTIDALVEELAVGHSVVTMRDQRKVRNHLRSVHAIALANLAELAGNIALVYSMPDDARFIVAAINIEYLKKARGTITAQCECPVPESSERSEYPVSVSLKDESGDEVVRATLRTLVGPKKAS